MAQKVRLSKDFDYQVPNTGAGNVVAYKKGAEVLMPEAHAEAARKAGVVENEPAKASEPKTKDKP